MTEQTSFNKQTHSHESCHKQKTKHHSIKHSLVTIKFKTRNKTTFKILHFKVHSEMGMCRNYGFPLIFGTQQQNALMLKQLNDRTFKGVKPESYIYPTSHQKWINVIPTKHGVWPKAIAVPIQARRMAKGHSCAHSSTAYGQRP
jgi:hypothetical protein